MNPKLSRVMRLGQKGLFLLKHLPDAGNINVFHCAAGIGDELLSTAVIRSFRQANPSKIWVVTKYPELFLRNPDVSLIVPPEQVYFDAATLLRGRTRILHYFINHPGGIGDPVPRAHLIDLMCENSGIAASQRSRPVIYLSDQEKEKGTMVPWQAVVQSSNLGSSFHMRNKEWYPDRMQAVVDQLKGKFRFIQLGTNKDAPLRDVLDLRGKTTVREAAAILSQSRFFVGLVGFLMHLARAVDCRSVIVYGGREHPGQSGYPENRNLYSDIECSPCWLWNTCDFGWRCMEMIRPQEVVDAVEQMTSRENESRGTCQATARFLP